MSFDAMRQHQKKIYLPLAVVVTVTFVFFFGAGSRGLLSLLRGTSSVSLEDELIRLGHELQAAGMVAPPPTRWYEQLAREEYGRHIDDEDELDKVVRETVRARVRAYYREMGAKLHYLPVEEGERLGVMVTDAELNDRVREYAKLNWGLETFSPKAYREELSSRSLTPPRFEQLLRGQMVRERVNRLLLTTAAASASERFYAYAREEQRVRVQYFQRAPGNFLEAVKVLPGEKPAPAEKEGAGEEKKEEPAAEKAEGEPEKKKAEEEKEAAGTLYEAEIAKAHAKQREDLVKSCEAKEEEKDFEWPPWAPTNHPELFSEPKARVEYLVALRRDFDRSAKKPTEAEITKYYEDNKDVEFKEEPPAKAGPGGAEKAEVKHKPLSAVRREIEKKLLTRAAMRAAAEAMEKAVKEYNDAVKEGGKLPTLAELAAKHKPLQRKEAAPATLDELEGHEHLGKLVGIGQVAKIGHVFDSQRRKQLGEDLTPHLMLEDDVGYLALRVVEFTPARLLDFKECGKAFTGRLVRQEAWKLAREAIDADHKALEEGKLNPELVRESKLLGPGDETCSAVAGYGLAVGEASKPYRYEQLLGPEAEKEDLRKKAEEKKTPAEKKAAEKKKPLEERVAETVDRGARGYRVVILAERRVPTRDEFRADREWKRRWKPPPMPEWWERFARQRGQLPRDTRWREGFLAELYQKKYEQLMRSGS